MIKKISVILFAVMVFSCSGSLDGRYAVNIDETKKNIVDNRQAQIMGMVQVLMTAYEFEIKGDTFIWYVNGEDTKDDIQISEITESSLIIEDNNGGDMEFKISGSNLLMLDPVLGIDIVWSKK